MKDDIFKKPLEKQFEFDTDVASVFDDMVSRSVPFYSQNLKLIVDIIERFASKNSKICDLGCSTSSLLLALFERRQDLKLSGVDNAQAMLNIAKSKSNAFGAKIDFYNKNLDEFDFFRNDVFIATYTMQFIRPQKRQNIINKIYENLNNNGIFIMSEKILYDDVKISKKMIEIYENYKQEQGYTRLEIATKREALENILIPYTQDENITMLKNAGFVRVESIFKWVNFETFIAFK
ncbi:carboxy-S-adenosyl-L-methionine synthase CmoA [Campylobacter insulaenigrae]|uniref:Carboxy-S-adenosyl-L-methionine synthase n=1 Tax=Campylobacter insulaenigrae TaxID=260714 RepID=A0ABY3G3Q8_9BACT|nr:carboxy-S-adenosyl-L-methionine synthase CmoA [Campylobacter insulaenigrae]MCR6570177.1 carboxy-S-adenosyl-L-methionine synthase CmoA [Campylobacter insulaenigrae]MCR6571962.1 carboxy-S-adenosyl-L-methionine synthase CmoA [Campylobacter insulaenigrae]MCR6573220.1 carboxy-S-adenosyl-L-methionine synthase CmoA [Campylobacter insulaenigrae]MCR6576311.1 carboxy-S-adenosyl-L-methionine synthase CmoA [Campylobacter insulaenigrae]MCR6578307.1 carboxy-S-adenosyl-L-methionine synthase CmoA [Campylob